MKIHNIALTALALMLSSPPILAKENVIKSKDDMQQQQQPPTFPGQPVDGQDEVTKRYIVKFKAGSKELKKRMKKAARQRSGANLRKPGDGASSSDAFGTFLPKDNAEVIYLSSEEDAKKWNEKDDVEYVELGKFRERLCFSC